MEAVVTILMLWLAVGVFVLMMGEDLELHHVVWWPVYLVKWLLKTLFAAVFTEWRA